MNQDDVIPILPLGAVLLPGTRLALQIFEVRYLDLISACLKAGAGFGVVRLLAGSEVYSAGRWREPRVAAVGCHARIVDWEALPHGMLGLIVQGEGRFRVGSQHVDRARVMYAAVEWLPAEPSQPLPPEYAEYAELVTSLARHPEVARLGMRTDPTDAVCVGNQLARLLPIPAAKQQELLELSDPLARLRAIETLLSLLR